MINNDLTHNCPQELELWVDNDSFLNSIWRKTLRTGNLTYIKDAFEEADFKYRDDQWEYLVDLFRRVLQGRGRKIGFLLQCPPIVFILIVWKIRTLSFIESWNSNPKLLTHEDWRSFLGSITS